MPEPSRTTLAGRVAGALRREVAALDARWRPYAIVVVAGVLLLLPHYHRDEPLFRWLASVGGRELADSARRWGLDLSFVLHALVPTGVLLLLREPLREHGLGLGRVTLGLRACVVGWLAYLPCFAVLLASDEVRGYYGGFAVAGGWGAFLRHQGPMVVGMVQTEIFYRGFLLFALARAYGPSAAILASVLPYAASHYAKPELEALGSIPVGLALSWIAWRTGSIWYGVFLHASIALVLNAAVFALG